METILTTPDEWEEYPLPKEAIIELSNFILGVVDE